MSRDGVVGFSEPKNVGRWGMYLLFISVLCLNGPCFADAAQRFQKEYPAAVEAIEEAYSHVRVRGTHTIFARYGADPHQFKRESRFEILRSGSSVRWVGTTITSEDPAWPVGSVTIYGGNSNLSFRCFKRSTDAAFTFTDFGPDPEFANTTPVDFLPAFAPSRVYGKKLLELLKVPQRRLVSVEETKFNGVDAVEVISEITYGPPGKTRTMREHFYLHSKTWATLGWLLERGNVRDHAIFNYDFSGGVPKIKMAETFSEDKAISNRRQDDETYNVSEVDFIHIPTEEFTPAALKQFGVKDVPVYDKSATPNEK